MTRLLTALLLITMLVSCSHKIYRHGYVMYPSDYSDCEVPVKKGMQRNTGLEKLGEIELGKCKKNKVFTREDAIKYLATEGCAAEADTVNIIEENNPEEWSTCYKCKAELYAKTKPASLIYITEEQKKQTRANKRKYWWGSGMAMVSIISFVIFRSIGN